MRKRLPGIVAGTIAAVTATIAIGSVGASGSTHSPVTFGYSGDTGPGYWGQLDRAWESCATGHRQSPIDITGARVDPQLRRLNLRLAATPIDLTNNGHTLEQEYEPGSTLKLGGVTYHLQQFHFHTLSEHAIRGQRGVMELHAVFKDNLVNPRKIAVVARLYRIGRADRFLARLIKAGLPRKEGDTVHSHAVINVAEGLGDTSAYYTYAGSLTTPPCTENVTWFVLKRPADLSQAQFKAFNGILGNDFRPLQDRSGRLVRATAR